LSITWKKETKKKGKCTAPQTQQKKKRRKRGTGFVYLGGGKRERKEKKKGESTCLDLLTRAPLASSPVSPLRQEGEGGRLYPLTHVPRRGSREKKEERGRTPYWVLRAFFYYAYWEERKEKKKGRTLPRIKKLVGEQKGKGIGRFLDPLYCPSSILKK